VEGPSLATRLTFISHAATAAQRRAAFPLDEPLEVREAESIAALGWSVPRAQRIWSGPEQRTQQTAEALGLLPTIAVDLRDCDYGAWSGYNLNEVELRQPEGVVAWLTDPGAAPHGGESVLQLIDRVARWLNAQRDAGHTLAITHPAVIRSALVHALEAPPLAFWRFDIPPLSLTDLRWNGKLWTVRSTGCAQRAQQSKATTDP
jgi:broad specificity phosphatase PhoE